MPWLGANGLLPGRGWPGRVPGRGAPGVAAEPEPASRAAGAAGDAAAGAAGADGAGVGALGAGAAGAGALGAGAGGAEAAGAAGTAGAGAAGAGALGAAAGAAEAGAFAAGAGAAFSAGACTGYFSLTRRTTGASTVELALLTYSPISLSRSRSTLLVTPSSLASALTRTLDTFLLFGSRPGWRGPSLLLGGAHC